MWTSAEGIETIAMRSEFVGHRQLKETVKNTRSEYEQA